ncbi:MAG: histidine kinase [Gallionellales bacterium GWA2_59_43]|nr:MAG: histidine kinase [Gallionellales bacterium GWA2_59_43]
MNSAPFAAQTGHSHLRRLVWLRAIAVVAQCAALMLAYQYLKMELQWLPMIATVTALSLLNLLAWLRLRSSRPVSNAELFTQLCADVFALSVLLYYGGGSTNPFISLFLLPLVIAAATLPHRYTWAMTALTTGSYTLLMKYYVPLPIPHDMSNEMSGMDHSNMDHMNHDMSAMGDMNSINVSDLPQDSIFNLHVFGMWLGFVISAVVVAYFVVKMAHAVRERDAALARVREETLRNERIVALGTQAAGAAHELGTPLSTLAVVIGELKNEPSMQPEWRDNLDILDGQVRACKRILDKLLAHAQDGETQQSLEQFLAETLDEWQLLRPTVHYSYRASSDQPAPQLRIDPALRAALLNLLNNAADASPDEIDIETRWDTDNFTLSIHDHGQGLTPEAAARAGSAFFTTKEEGRGLGLFLANATVERMNGKVRLFNREGGGATTEITLPLRT